MKTRIASTTKEVIIGDGPTVLIGERINPSGRQKLIESLKAGSMDLVRKEAIDQVKAGADIIDVNVTVFGTDEVKLLAQAVKTVNEAVETPICIDSSNIDALEAALKIATGKPLVNSVTGEERSLSRVLPLIKEFGVSVVGLLQDDQGIPHDVERRVAIAHHIVERAAKYGIPPENIILDCMAFAVGAEPSSGRSVLGAIARIKAELGVNMTMGLSNMSFGMPDRSTVNNAFVSMAIAAGATCFIVDAARIRPAILAADLLLEKDRHARRYIQAFRSRQAEKPQA